MSQSFERMANEDPEISHLMRYRHVRAFVKMLDEFHQTKAQLSINVQLNFGGIASVCVVIPEKKLPCPEWQDFIAAEKSA